MGAAAASIMVWEADPHTFTPESSKPQLARPCATKIRQAQKEQDGEMGHCPFQQRPVPSVNLPPMEPIRYSWHYLRVE
jgi:hypothetical protein